jgi:selenocysteine lyase/cysteine desulfurase
MDAIDPAQQQLDASQQQLDAAQQEFDAEVTYLNTATLGLPPRRSWEPLQAAQADWRAGRADAQAYDRSVASARALFAGLCQVDPSWVAVGSQVSAMVGLVAASLPAGSQVLTATEDFTSVLFPFLAQAGRGVTVREVPLDGLLAAITPEVSLVAVSAVQSADGRVLDLDSLRAVGDANGVPILLDVTQAAGWLPVGASRFEFTVCAGYKWLLAPRGTAYFSAHPALWDAIIPHAAGWYAGEPVWSSIYGGPLRLAPDARRFDVSPAWHAWVAAAPALELLTSVGVPTLHRHAVTLANRFRTGVGLPSSDSAIVSVAVTEDGPAVMASAGIIAAQRAGRLRLSFHLSTTEADVDRAVEALAPCVVGSPGGPRTG